MSNTADVLMVDGQFIGYLPPMENFELLWENPSPSASFAGQQITLASDDYDLLLVIVNLVNRAYSISNIVPKGSNGWFSAEQTTTASYTTVTTRSIAYVDDTTISFSSGYKQNSNGARVSDNNVLIPYKIYGIKLQGSALGNAGNVYSTTEHIVGKWIDGKPLYEKTINTGALPNNTNKFIPHNITNLNQVISISGYAYNGAGITFPLPYLNPTSVSSSVGVVIFNAEGNRNIRISTASDLSGYTDSYIILRYTKTS